VGGAATAAAGIEKAVDDVDVDRGNGGRGRRGGERRGRRTQMEGVEEQEGERASPYRVDQVLARAGMQYERFASVRSITHEQVIIFVSIFAFISSLLGAGYFITGPQIRPVYVLKFLISISIFMFIWVQGQALFSRAYANASHTRGTGDVGQEMGGGGEEEGGT